MSYAGHMARWNRWFGGEESAACVGACTMFYNSVMVSRHPNHVTCMIYLSHDWIHSTGSDLSGGLVQLQICSEVAVCGFMILAYSRLCYYAPRPTLNFMCNVKTLALKKNSSFFLKLVRTYDCLLNNSRTIQKLNLKSVLTPQSWLPWREGRACTLLPND